MKTFFALIFTTTKDGSFINKLAYFCSKHRGNALAFPLVNIHMLKDNCLLSKIKVIE